MIDKIFKECRVSGFMDYGGDIASSRDKQVTIALIDKTWAGMGANRLCWIISDAVKDVMYDTHNPKVEL